MSNIIEAATNSKAWPFVEARRVLEHIGGKTPKKGFVLFETGYGPSGLPHIGTFAEVVRTTMIRNAFHTISDIPTKLICFSDDMDGIRKVPENIPNREMVTQHLNKPLTSVPDPFGEFPSYGDYMNAKLKSFLDQFGFEYDFMSATECYKSGMFNNGLTKCLENYQQIMDIMLPTLGDERKATYSPFMPLCPKTGAVLQVKIEEIKPASKTIVYRDLEGNLVEMEITDGKCKLQWKPDFAMRWAELDVDFEMYGKDHRPNAQVYSNLCKALKGKPPVQYFYELFLDQDGKKISKSKGNSISVEEWLHYAPSESLALFMYHNPQRAKKLFFEIIPKSVDEYISLNNQYQEEELEQKLQNPLYHMHNGDVDKIEVGGISFALLLNLVSACNTEDKEILWGYIEKYAPGTSPENAPYIDHMTEYALNYYNDFIKSNKQFLSPNSEQKELLKQLVAFLTSIPTNSTGEEIQKGIYTIGRESNYENLRDYFADLYKILLGQSSGPRLGSFIALFGCPNMINLINDRLVGRTA